MLPQLHYIEEVLKRFNNFDCKPITTPFDVSLKLEKNAGEPVSQPVYARAIGCLMYAMSCTRPDIAFIVGKLSRYASNPSHAHVVRSILKYLMSSIDRGLHYCGYSSVL